MPIKLIAQEAEQDTANRSQQIRPQHLLHRFLPVFSRTEFSFRRQSLRRSRSSTSIRNSSTATVVASMLLVPFIFADSIFKIDLARVERHRMEQRLIPVSHRRCLAPPPRISHDPKYPTPFSGSPRLRPEFFTYPLFNERWACAAPKMLGFVRFLSSRAAGFIHPSIHGYAPRPGC